MSDETPDASAAPKPPKNTVVVILLVLNLLTVAGTAGYFIMFGAKSHAAAEHKEPEEHGHKLGPMLALSPLVANISGGEGEEGRYLKLSTSVEVKDEASVPLVEHAMVPIRDALLMHLSGVTVQDTMGPAARTKLQAKMVELINHAVGDELVKRVFFTEFVIQ